MVAELFREHLRAMAGSSDGYEAKSRLEVFDGSDPSLYRNWRRRAKLMIAALPTTIGKDKFGAKLMEHIRGEAEALLETVDVDIIIKAGGDAKIIEMLDEKYMPQPRDLLQAALKGYFYDLSIKPGESFLQFVARYDVALRKLKEQEIELPSQVKGYMLLKKLRLDHNQESLVLTATQGKMDLPETLQAVRAVFPEGRGSSRSSKEIFVTEHGEGQDEEACQQAGGELKQEMQEVMEIVAAEIQNNDEAEDEDAVEAFEAYAQVRRKILESKRRAEALALGVMMQQNGDFVVRFKENLK